MAENLINSHIIDETKEKRIRDIFDRMAKSLAVLGVHETAVLKCIETERDRRIEKVVKESFTHLKDDDLFLAIKLYGKK